MILGYADVYHVSEYQPYSMACSFPITIKNPAHFLDRSALAYIPVPCGKCPKCLDTRVNGWIFRMQQHEKISTSCHFVTLTYGTNDDPQGRLTPNGLKTLVKKDYQDFMKRLRNQYRYRAINPETGRYKYYYDKIPPIKYFACGEYGAKRQRPHFHAIIYNSDEQNITKSWPHGFVHIGTVTGASIAYTLKYMCKPSTVNKNNPLDDRTPEFQLVSQYLGINYLSKAIIQYHQNDLTRLYCTHLGGIKFPMPRYYRNKIFTDIQRKHQARLAQQLQLDNLVEKQRLHIQEHGDLTTFYRLEVERKHAYLRTWRAQSPMRNTIF